MEAAVAAAIDSMPEDSILKPFLNANRAEVTRMCITEYDEEYTMNLFREEGREEGIKEGRDLRDTEKIAEMLNAGKTPEAIADFCGYPLEQVEAVKSRLNS